MLKEDGYVLSWAAKWLGEKTTHYANEYEDGRFNMLTNIHFLLGEADAVVHFNGTRFDIPWLNGEFAREHLAPPAPYHQIDLLKTVRSQFRFPSNKLEFVSKALGIGHKFGDMNFKDWEGCMNNDPASWAKMIKYNISDVTLTEKLYNRLLPWIKQHPNVALYQDDKLVCPSCGSDHSHKGGSRVLKETVTTRAQTYQRYQCQNCGTWYRGTAYEKSPAKVFARVAHA